MNPFRHSLPLLAILILAGLSPFASAQQQEIDCRPVVENFRQNVEAAPTHVLTLLEDVLIANGGHCVPQFVKVAIEASGANADTVKKIVFVAVTNAQQQAPQIAEAAVAANPKYADAVRAGFAEAFEDQNPRLQPTAPAEQPAWAEKNAPVPEPAAIPRPAPPVGPPAVAPGGNPPALVGPAGPRDAGWDLLHDGVVDPIQPADLAGVDAPPPGEAPMNLEEAVDPEIPESVDTEEKKKPFRLGFPKLADLPKPKLPEFKLPEFKAPEIKLPEFKVPEFEMPEWKAPDLALPALPEADAPMDLLLTGPFSGIPTFAEPEPQMAPPPVMAPTPAK